MKLSREKFKNHVRDQMFSDKQRRDNTVAGWDNRVRIFDDRSIQAVLLWKTNGFHRKGPIALNMMETRNNIYLYGEILEFIENINFSVM